MLPFYTLVASFVLFKVLGLLGLSYFEGWHTSLQGAVAVMLLLAASAPWGTRRENHSLSNQPQSTDSITETVNETPLAEVMNIPSNPPVEYDPAWSDRTGRSSNGHLVNSCVPDELREKATTLATSDGVYLSALVLGSGDKGVLLAHEQGYNICSFVDMGTELADSGYLVVIPEYRITAPRKIFRRIIKI